MVFSINQIRPAQTGILTRLNLICFTLIIVSLKSAGLTRLCACQTGAFPYSLDYLFSSSSVSLIIISTRTPAISDTLSAAVSTRILEPFPIMKYRLSLVEPGFRVRSRAAWKRIRQWTFHQSPWTAFRNPRQARTAALRQWSAQCCRQGTCM